MPDTDWLEQNRPALASAITSLAWVADGIDDAERPAVQELVDIEVLFGTDSAPALVNKPWVSDGLDEHAFTVVETLARLTESAEEAAKQILAMAFLETVEAVDADAVVALVGLTIHESELFNAVVERPWLDDGLDEAEALLLQKLEAIAGRYIAADLWIATFAASPGRNSLSEDSLVERYDVDASGTIEHAEVLLAVTDYSETKLADDEFTYIATLYAFSEALIQTPQLMELVMATSWYRHGIDEYLTYTEPKVVRTLQEIANNNPSLAQTLSLRLWIFDEPLTTYEMAALEHLARLNRQAPELLRLVIRLPWLAADVNSWEVQALGGFSRLALRNNPDLAAELVAAPWVVDGMTYLEAALCISSLSYLAIPDIDAANPQFARQVMDLIRDPPDSLDFIFTNTMASIHLRSPDQFNRLLMEPWLVDGLDEKERIYLIAAGSTGETAKRLFDPYTIASKSIELPLAGPVNLWVVGHYQIDYQNTLEKMERAVRGTEGFWEIPFHTNHVIFYPLEPGRRGSHIGTVMYLDTVDGDVPELDMYLIVSYYHFARGPSWFRGGGSLVVQAFIFNNGNLPDPVSPSYCSEQGLDNLQALNDLRDRNPGFLWEWCNFSMGEHFLLTLRNVMGKDAWLSALRAFYLQYVRNYVFITYTGVPLGDEDVYHVFLEHTPPELVDDVKDVFRRLHGGPFIDQDG